MVDLRYLQDFLDLARSGNFSATARNRSISQPALTRRIQQLEDWAGRRLFDRSRTPLGLTAAGEELLPIAARVVEELEAYRVRSREHVDARVRCMSIHSLASWASHAVDSESSAAISFGTYNDCFGALRDSTTDVILVCQSEHVRDPRFRGLARERIGSETFLPVAARDYAAKTGGTQALIELARDNYLGDALAAVIETCRNGQGYVVGSVAHRIDAVRGLVEAGAGIGWLPEHMIEADLQTGKLRRVADVNLEVRLDVVLLAASSERLDTALGVMFPAHPSRKSPAPLPA